MSTPKSRRVRQNLLRAARELITERGWNAVSTRTLAERAGVGPGLVHYHFPSLRALLNEAALTGMASVVDGSLARLGGADPRHGLDAFLRDLDAYPAQDPSTTLFTEAYLAATRDPALRQGITDLLHRLREHLTTWLRRGGVPEPETTARLLAATADGLMLHRCLDPATSAHEAAPVLRRLLTAPPEEEP